MTESTGEATSEADTETEHRADEAVDDGEVSEGTDGEPDADDEGPASGSTGVRGYLYRGALVLLVLLAVVAALQLYFAVGRAISIWISDDFAPVFQAAFNLAVLLATGVGISLVLRRMGE